VKGVLKMLSHIKVLDLSRILAAPFATQILGDYGATVFKVEHCETGDDTRAWGPPFTEQGHESAYFLAVNRNKKSVAVNLKHQRGIELLRQLAARCHVVVENFPAGKLSALGLGYEQLKIDNPKLVYCSVTGFGLDGPNRDKLAYDVMVSGIGGSCVEKKKNCFVL
jgi:crotonobetainyl-CoA:carnitine CoA-transferase CaiB-like acyl-CoA transferase